MTATATLITTKDEKGRHWLDNLCATVYNKAKLDEDRAQRLNENGGEFQRELKELIEKYSVTNQFADEEAESSYTYPDEYTGVKPIAEQVDILAKIFGLSLGLTSEWIEKVLPTLTLPDGAEGWFAIPSIDAVAKRFFSNVKDPAERYCKAVQLVHEKLAASRKFYNYRDGQITTKQLRVHPRTLQALEAIAKEQEGDILIIPAQFGLRHRGRSVRRVREVFNANEFGLGTFAVGCMALTHPERYIRWEQLHTDCPGDEFADSDGDFVRAPIFNWYDGKLKFNAYWYDNAFEDYGSVSAFLPQK